ncbi:unnamed protein product [Adineta ricciae]|uniref:Uncharacterized protein n=1 Tax=Adineta ricciae TaxID=249248 RepID=A0A814LTN5_ADIRI|nr:unnamed protein product [Adineta ricciae]CAF1418181.1 unnamed protein product [Adineta ricciae]
MIELCDLSADDETCDVVTSSNTIDSTLDKIGSSPNTCRSPGQNSTDSIIYNISNIKRFLKEQPDKYVLVGNHKVNPTKPADCWNRFSLLAVKDETGGNTVIKNFATFRSRYTTYPFNIGSTKSLNSHICAPSTSSSPSFSIRTQWKSKASQLCGGKKM